MKKTLTQLATPRHPLAVRYPRSYGLMVIALSLVGIAYIALLLNDMFTSVPVFLTFLLGLVAPLGPYGIFVVLFGLPIDSEGEAPWLYSIFALGFLYTGLLIGVGIGGILTYLLLSSG